MRYVTYDPSGSLTGCYLQEVHPDHVENHIEIDEALALEWPAYCANAERDGVELAPVVERPPQVPQEVTSRQAHEALIRRGHDVAIEGYINAIVDPMVRKLTRNEYEQSAVFERHRPLVLTIGAALNLDLDELFIFASTL